MFIACPQCRYLVAVDPRTQATPVRCTRCSALLDPGSDADAAGGPSLASLLRHDDAGAQADAAGAPPPATATPLDEPATTAAVVDAGADAALVAAPADADASTAADLSTPGQPVSDADKPAAADVASTGADHGDVLAAPVAPVRSAPPPPRTTRVPPFLRGRGARAQPGRGGAAAWQWAAIVVLLLSLVLQILLADRARLAADPAWRPLLSGMCGLFGCDLPAWREPQAFVMLDRDVRPLPQVAGVLQARATFRNDARWSQPWPILLLTLKDADGRDLGARAITPAEYLRGSAANSELAPGQSAQVAVDIREPSANVVAFSFDFR